MHLRTGTRSFFVGVTLAALAPLAFSQSGASSTPTPPAAPTLQSLPPAGENANPFPPPDPRNFTAATPSKQEVDDFLRATWGYDSNRIWQVQAILKTPAEGVNKVVVLVAEKGQPKEQISSLVFFSLPDGKHILAGDVIPFGAKPFEETRELLHQADGPSRGASAGGLELVEFADFECPHCKEAQSTVSQLLTDYPKAHFVFENFPLVSIHSEAFKAAAYGVCVAQQSGSPAFFKFADAVFDAQNGLTPASSDATLKAAVAKAGGDAEKVAACSATPATKDAVDAQMALGTKAGVNQTPMLFVDGREVPIGAVPYDTLRSMIDFQAAQDGIPVPPHPAAAPAPATASKEPQK